MPDPRLEEDEGAAGGLFQLPFPFMGAGRKSKFPFMERAVYRQFLKHRGRGLAAKVESFWEFVCQMRSLHDYPLDLILNEDQTPLFLEMPAERTLEMKGARTVHVRSAGYEKERVTVMLAVTASRLKLPPLSTVATEFDPDVPVFFGKCGGPCTRQRVDGRITCAGLDHPEELVKKEFVTCGIYTPIDGSEDHLILAHMRDKGEVEVLDDVNDLVDDELVVNPFYAKVPMPAEELQAAAEEADAAEEDAEAAAVEEEGGVLEEGGEAEEPSDDEWWRPGRFDGEDCEEWHAGDDFE
ncbi:unnamed protein product [Closterium sp. NIES-53]